MISIEDERLDRLVGTLDRWFLAFVILFFATDAAIAWPYSGSFLGWLFQVFIVAVVIFPVTAFLAYLVLMAAWQFGVNVNALRGVALVIAALITLYALYFLIGFARNPTSYESGLFGLVIPLGIAGATFRFWSHRLK